MRTFLRDPVAGLSAPVWLWITLDEAANAAGADGISDPASRVAVRIIPTDEELTIARHTLETLDFVHSAGTKGWRPARPEVDPKEKS